MMHQHTSQRFFRLSLATIMLWMTCGSAHATSVTYAKITTLPELYAATDQLVSTLKYHIAGARRYAARHSEGSTPADFEAFSTEWSRSTLARMEYRWTNASGVSHTTIYHAMSGRTAAAALAPLNSPLVEQYDMPDWHLYFGDRNPNVYARIPQGEPSALDELLGAQPPIGIGRGYDAEIRALRTIERDIRSGGVPAGGKVVAWVSAPPCSTCRQAMKLFAETYGIDIHVVHLPRPADYPSDAFKTVQQAKNRFLRRFADAVSFERTKAPALSCLRQ